MKIGINGMGRVGRCVLRAVLERKMDDVDIVFINTTADPKTTLHLLRYDSAHGPFAAEMSYMDDTLIIGTRKIKLTAERDPAKISLWRDVDVVMDCTGAFLNPGSASVYLEAGAKRVMLSAPTRDSNIPMIIYGVNHDSLDKDRIISVGSCTTNCLGPIVKVLHEAFGILKGFALTVHSYTNDQNLVDNNHKDLRRSRAACVSMIPTTTGAAKSIGRIFPDLDGMLDGSAIRVPTHNVSLVDLTATVNRKVTVDEVNKAVEAASARDIMSRVLRYCTEPLVSIDFSHTEHSSIFDALETRVIDGDLVRVLMWYDNEWGFAVRMLDVAMLWYKLS